MKRILIVILFCLFFYCNQSSLNTLQQPRFVFFFLKERFEQRVVDISPLARRCHCIFTSSKATNMIYLAAVLSSRSASHPILLFAMLFLLQCVAYTLANNNDQNYILATRKQKGKRMSLKKRKMRSTAIVYLFPYFFPRWVLLPAERTNGHDGCIRTYTEEKVFQPSGKQRTCFIYFPSVPLFFSLSLFIVGWITFSPKCNHSSCSRDSIAQLFGLKFEENRSYLFRFHLW